MPSFEDLYPSKYVKSSDIEAMPTRQVPVQIANIVPREEMGDNKHKPVLYFVGATKGMVLNKTNAQRLGQLFGDDYLQWVGQHIVLVVEQTQDRTGKNVMGVRVLHPNMAAAELQTRQNLQPPAAVAPPQGAYSPMAGPAPSQAPAAAPVQPTPGQPIADGSLGAELDDSIPSAPEWRG